MKFFKFIFFVVITIPNIPIEVRAQSIDRWTININDTEGVFGSPRTYRYTTQGGASIKSLSSEKGIEVAIRSRVSDRNVFVLRLPREGVSRQGFYPREKTDGSLFSRANSASGVSAECTFDFYDIKVLTTERIEINPLRKFFISGDALCRQRNSRIDKKVNLVMNLNWEGETPRRLDTLSEVIETSSTNTPSLISRKYSLLNESRVSSIELYFSPEARSSRGIDISSVNLNLSGPSEYGAGSSDINPRLFSGTTVDGKRRKSAIYRLTFGNHLIDSHILTPRADKIDLNVAKKGLSKVELLDIRVFAKPAFAAWQNQNNKFDVNGDGVISPIDSLVIINFISRNGSSFKLPELHPAIDAYVDVNGDGFASPIDSLQVINELNRR